MKITFQKHLWLNGKFWTKQLLKIAIACDLSSKQSNRKIDPYKVFYIFDKTAFINYPGSVKQKYHGTSWK